MLESIFNAMKILFGVMVVLLVVLNLLVSRSLWKPFYASLEKIRQFVPDEPSPVSFPKVNITEFGKLNLALEDMARRIQTDFQRQKQFIENASHEMQTPLSVIRTRLEMLIQSDRLTESEMKAIQSVYEATDRLSRLNKTLLLLSKIENRQFEDKSAVNLKKTIEKIVSNLDDQVRIKNLELSVNLEEISQVMNIQLAEILITNLLQNSIRHNREGGWIKIALNSSSLEVSNTGKALLVNPQNLFARFAKGDPSGDSHGLGLSIVKQVCDLYGFGIRYETEGDTHRITINFHPHNP
jgi:signal transduction histidine kinase